MSKAVYSKINEIVIKGLETKGLSWFKPWKNNQGEQNAHHNYATGRRYNGINIFMLNATALDNQYETGEWLTFKQIKSYKNAKLLKGSKATPVVFWSVFFVDSEGKIYKEDGPDREKRFSLKYYNVFNIAQVEGLESKATPMEDTGLQFTPDEKAENIIAGYNNPPRIDNKGGERAYYMPALDGISMPVKNYFVDSDSYYKVLFHEMIHSTGHTSRLNRKSLNTPNSNKTQYSREELIAEIGAMYLTGIADLNPKSDEQNSVVYINGWISHLKNHEKEAVTAMSHAAKATEWILGTAKA